ncbi:TPA: hypothetical protein ACF01X_000659 [Yersinia enterocolitica]
MSCFQLKDKQSKPCKFCSILSNHSRDGKINSPWLFNSKYAAMVSIGSLVPGWSLICPKEHKINLVSEYTQSEFWEFATEAVSAIEALYGKTTIFEHGAFDNQSKTGCGTWHAHLHAVPLNFSLENAVFEFAPDMSWEKCKVSDISQISNGVEYLFMSENFSGISTEGYICILKKETSQFFRRVIANELGQPDEFDYKLYAMDSISGPSAEKLTSYYEEKYKNTQVA